jgi:hypothetical protein
MGRGNSQCPSPVERQVFACMDEVNNSQLKFLTQNCSCLKELHGKNGEETGKKREFNVHHNLESMGRPAVSTKPDLRQLLETELPIRQHTQAGQRPLACIYTALCDLSGRRCAYSSSDLRSLSLVKGEAWHEEERLGKGEEE